MTAREFHLPDLGEGLQEAEIIAWHVHPGDRVVGICASRHLRTLQRLALG